MQRKVQLFQLACISVFFFAALLARAEVPSGRLEPLHKAGQQTVSLAELPSEVASKNSCQVTTKLDQGLSSILPSLELGWCPASCKAPCRDECGMMWGCKPDCDPDAACGCYCNCG